MNKSAGGWRMSREPLVERVIAPQLINFRSNPVVAEPTGTDRTDEEQCSFEKLGCPRCSVSRTVCFSLKQTNHFDADSVLDREWSCGKYWLRVRTSSFFPDVGSVAITRNGRGFPGFAPGISDGANPRV